MSYQFLFSERFKTDIREARKWYNREQPGLGKKFYAEVKSKLQAIRKSPKFQLRYNEVRCLPLKKYPFMIHYTVDDTLKIILVLACIHCSLNPHGHWLSEDY
jgi:hypothetical protein